MALAKTDEALEDKLEACSLQDSKIFKFNCHLDWKKDPTKEVWCAKSDTVLKALKELLNPQKPNEEFIIKRQRVKNSAIATHFPCHLLDQEEPLVVSKVTTKLGVVPEEGADDTGPDPLPEKYVTFFLDPEGGKNTSNKKLLKNPKLKKHVPFCVYGLKGETLRQALSRDGRFMDVVTTDKCHLYDKERMVTLAITQLVDNQIGRHFQITFERKKNERRDGSSSPEETNGSPPDEVAEQGHTPRNGVEEDTSQPDDDLSKVFEIAQEMRLKNENFGKIQPPFADFNRIRQITTLGESVCKVDVGGLKTGTGFVLFENFILTNAHLFENPCVRSTMTLSVAVRCIFNYEKCLGKKSISVGAKPVLIDYQFDPDETKRALDYAILELDLETMKPKNKKLPPGLLSKYGPVPDSGEACLIGHPQGGVKLLDATSIIPKKNRRDSVESVLMIKVKDNIQKEINNLPKVVTYYTYFYHGSSGSPVFDAFGRVFGLHTASIYFRDGCSLIEYALPLEDIMKSFVKRLKRDGPEQLLSMVQEVAEKNLMLRECISRDIPEPMDH